VKILHGSAISQVTERESFLNQMQFRQGDVFLFRVAAAPKAMGAPILRESGAVVLAHGEVTGHKHQIFAREAELFALPDTDDRFLRIMAASGVALVHEEHTTITLPAGDYRVRIQREYTSADQAPLRVAD